MGQAPPKGPGRRRIAAAAVPAPEPAALPPTPAPEPVPPPAAAAPPPPVAAKPAQPATPVVMPVHRNSTKIHEFVADFIEAQNWEPWRWRMVEVMAVDLHPALAVPRVERSERRRPQLGRRVRLSLHQEWGHQGRFVVAPYCEPPVGPSAASTFSEILSLSLHGFVCERALTVDTSPYVRASEPEAEASPVGDFAPVLPRSAGEGLGTNQLPRPQGGIASWRAEAASPIALPPRLAPARLDLSLDSRLPEIDWTVERLDRVASRLEPGLVRLRSPRVKMPMLARLVKPAAGSSGPPIRVRPGVRPPKGSVSNLAVLAMPSGAKLPLSFDRPVTGLAVRVEIREDPQAFETETRPAVRPKGSVQPGIPFARLQPLALEPAGGLALTEGSSPAIETGYNALALPRVPYLRGAEFDPPACGLLRLALKVDPRGRSRAKLATPALRPVISYRWAPVKPELEVRTVADWASAPTPLAPLSLRATAPEQQAPPATPAFETVPAEVPASFASVRYRGKAAVRTGTPSVASRLLPISLEECTPKPGNETPVSKLEHISPRPGHQLRKSTIKTQADWQRSKWTSASAYGSALWRIAIGRFSGALDQAPKMVRWVAAVGALALGAFALLPGDGPAAPHDTGWTIANNPGPAPAPVAAVPPPPPQPPPRVKTQPVRTARVRGRAARGQNAANDGAGISLTSAWDNFQKRLSDRAAVAFTDDFRNGLADWEGSGDWARSWSYDASGFVRTGALALLASARDLTDYRMEFLGQIERRSMGWVVRAADLRNYYALKLTIVADGPEPEVALIRYPVINGVAGAASQQLLPLEVRTDTVYRVQTEVRDDYYAVIVQGKVVDSWTDGRLKRGSIGLFSGKGELARVRWVGVWHQYDTLGRLCALLAPSGLPGRERGANQ